MTLAQCRSGSGADEQMTVPEKVAQLYGVWVGLDAAGGGVAPHQHELASDPVDWDELIRTGSAS